LCLQHSLPSYQDANSPLNNFSIPSLAIGAGTVEYNPLADQKTKVSLNIFDAIGIQRSKCPNQPCKLPGHYIDNLIGGSTPDLPGTEYAIKTGRCFPLFLRFSIDNAEIAPFSCILLKNGGKPRSELRDPWNWDFRPCPKSKAAALGAGAYSPRDAEENGVYWIPGALETQPATPIPKDEGSAVVVDTDLMFLPAYRAVGHAVLLGPAAQGAAGRSTAWKHL